MRSVARVYPLGVLDRSLTVKTLIWEGSVLWYLGERPADLPGSEIRVIGVLMTPVAKWWQPRLSWNAKCTISVDVMNGQE